MEKDRYKNPMEEYMGYLRRYTSNNGMGMWQAHQLLTSRMVAEMYGLSKEEVARLDEDL